ncbi:hypothetical protein CBR_g41290 [Chara braunii]|uniref:Uncharacterized protein n=1 Tax=Chara braunii TaxID=69332 RepID=A0A388LVE4_CHABU|nr:hypothetical protein CBR_g41290 [Chara braunii]|eukprot:GBG86296.1 hypothetical protein CBR_g41290 [Chara braunii]
MDTLAAFVNCDLLKSNVGKRVRTVIKVNRIENGAIVGEGPGGGVITVKPGRRGLDTAPNRYREVIGIAEGGSIIAEEVGTDFGDKFDLQNFNELCKLASKDFQALFM